MARKRQKDYGLGVSLSTRMHRGKKKWQVMQVVDGRRQARLFDSYEKAREAHDVCKANHLLAGVMKSPLPDWREYVSDREYAAIVMWNKYRDIYEKFTGISSQPLHLVVREAMKTLLKEIESGTSFGRQDDGYWEYTEEEKVAIQELDRMSSFHFILSQKPPSKAAKTGRLTFSAAIEEYSKHVEKKHQAGHIGDNHRTNVINELKKWVKGWEEVSVHEISPEMIEAKLSSFSYRDKPIGRTSQRRYRSTLHSFFSWAQSRRMVTRNPIAQTISPKPEKTVIGIITPSDLQKLLSAGLQADKAMLSRIVLSAFCGLRRSEVTRISAEAINLEKKHVFIAESISKSGKQRYVPLPYCAIEWLKLGEFETPPSYKDRNLIEQNYGTRLKKIAGKAGITLPKNALRHSFATYAAAKTHNLYEVALWMGHSNSQMTERHYREGVPKSEGNAWFSVRPPSQKNGA